MTNAIIGVGTEFNRWDGSEWVSIAEVKNISGPDKSREIKDATSFDSTGGYREFVSALRDSGSITITMNFSRSGYETLNDDFEDDDKQDYQIVLPDDDTTTFEFEGLVTELPLEVPHDDIITCDVTIKISDSITVSSGS